MSEPEVLPATAQDRESVVATVVAAFDRDPAFRYFFDSDDFTAQAATFAGYLFDKRVSRGTVWMVGQAQAVSLWDGPASDGPLPSLDLPAAVLARLDAYRDAVHGVIPQTPHWYLGVLATHPGHAGKRLGRAVMRAGLDRAAADALPAYLETTNPGNVELYRRSGWEVARAIDSGPVPIWVMKNKAVA
ncbi:GNAT family N-acetyltransferase [Rhizocola hellebori]|nr:GNAT family N-acetyltransferase [Rhizocola hellebori]